MKNIIAFAGSNSKNSINKQLAVYAANQIKDVDVRTLDLNDFHFFRFCRIWFQSAPAGISWIHWDESTELEATGLLAQKMTVGRQHAH